MSSTIGETAAIDLVEQAARLEDYVAILSTKITDAKLSVRSGNKLKAMMLYESARNEMARLDEKISFFRGKLRHQ